ncbi:MAG TPA: S41 family peptidase [Candidatus Angelobacter sp.]
MPMTHANSNRCAALVLLLCIAAPCRESAAQAQPPADETLRVQRLVALGKLWGAIKYFHPYLGYREDIDWDKAGVEAIAKVNQAKSPAEYADAVEGMLQALGDPATRVRRDPPGRAHATPADALDPSFRTLADGVLVVSLSRFGEEFSFSSIMQRTAAVATELPKAKAVLFDLRLPAPPAEDQDAGVNVVFQYGKLGNMLTSTPLSLPGERRRMHVGFVPQRGGTSGGYESAFFIAQRARISPGTSSKDLPIVFLVNGNSQIPPEALALEAAGKAAIVAEGPINDSAFVSTQRFKLADGVEAEIRLGELIYADGSTGIAADETVQPSPATGDENPAFQQALALAKNFKTSPGSRRHVAASASIMQEKPYPEMSYPAREYRILAAFKIWTVINYFFPYKDLMGEDWDSVLREYIPRLEKAGNVLDYNLTVAEMATRFHDGHGFVVSPALREYFGVAASPLRLQMVEGLPVVVGFLNEEAAKDAQEAGVEIGDVILKVDGEEAKERLARISRYISASTPQWQAHRAVSALINGPEGSTATVTVRDGKGQVRELKLLHKGAYLKGEISERSGPPYTLLSPAIGYADLDRLEVSMVDEMFEKFRDTKAIIFDDRTYPRGTAWAIAPRLTEKDSVVGAVFTRRVAMFPESPMGEIATSSTAQTFEQRIPRSDKWKYKGKTVMLIDERAISQAEHTGLFFEAAGGTKFIGSPTAGANGDVTSFCVPGGIWISFTGQAVRHADGRQLQRVGLKPDIEVRPTLKGIRAGKDEVLERAVDYLTKVLK